MNKSHVMIALTVVILLGLLYILIRLGVPQKAIESASDALGKKPEENKINRQEEESRNAEESGVNSDANIAGGGGSGGSSGGASSGGSSGASETSGESSCYSIRLSYSLEDFQTNATCNAYQGPHCIDKTVICSLSVKNLDHDATGDFEIIFNFIAQDQQLDTGTDIHTVPPEESRAFLSSKQFFDQNAKEEIACTFESGSVPEKTICP